MEKKQKKILIKNNGPYIVTGNIPLVTENMVNGSEGYPLEWEKGWKKFPKKEAYSLCRCGKTKSAPYCDGNHEKIKFNGKETARNIPYNKQMKVYEGPKISLADAESYCMGAGFCDPSGSTWGLTENSDNKAYKELAIEQACNCPSGRLTAIDNRTGRGIEPDFKMQISVTQDPENMQSSALWVKGGIPIVSENGTKYEVRNRVTLCRCGRSKNKPFCDGAHVDAGFDDGNIE